ncbi:metalloregulator ArsR/SmtB family transcription factor [Nitratireductor sp. CAU 1489]|uniref:Metalloregulator ArsR/SmtB family transcription factor n=1 Tax=Nitratireductor arenosus TaxID=2682096 RepID=A0A844QPM1_9HYPH|nr:metalloregulator ArsR/SmtB family transcription factor [Nitratireductor arenosus]MVA99529.1 metalloregulator ArsR/SmtB family transcription factor [Nitratireductor arenosus]
MRMDIDRLDRSAESAAELLSALANKNRLMILCNLLNGEMAVQPLAEAVGMSQSALSQQLAKLRLQRLVATRRVGREIHYRVASAEVAEVLATLYRLYCDPVQKTVPRGEVAAAS